MHWLLFHAMIIVNNTVFYCMLLSIIAYMMTQVLLWLRPCRN